MEYLGANLEALEPDLSEDRAGAVYSDGLKRRRIAKSDQCRCECVVE